jgi:hypothetical protein
MAIASTPADVRQDLLDKRAELGLRKIHMAGLGHGLNHQVRERFKTDEVMKVDTDRYACLVPAHQGGKAVAVIGKTVDMFAGPAP